MKKLIVLLFVLVIALPSTIYASGEFPNKPIRVYVSYGAGGSTDVTMRALANIAEKKLGQPIVVENKTGGTGTYTPSLIARAKPDGYLLGFVGTPSQDRTPHIIKVKYSPIDDFEYICKVALWTPGVACDGKKNWNSFADIVKDAKSKGKKGLSYSNVGAFEIGVIAMNYVAESEGIILKAVPYTTAEAWAAVYGGHVDFLAGVSLSGRMSDYKTGKLKFLSVFSNKRFEMLPDVPTLSEEGYDFAIDTGMMLIAPKGLDPKIQQILEKAFLEAANDPEFKKLMKNMGQPLDIMKGEELRASLKDSSKLLRTVLLNSGMIKE